MSLEFTEEDWRISRGYNFTQIDLSVLYLKASYVDRL